MAISDIKKMSITEKLQTMESLWSNLLQEEADIASPQWHADVLAERKSRIESGEAKFISLDSLKQYNNR